MKFRLIFLFIILPILLFAQKKKNASLEIKEDYGFYGKVSNLSFSTRMKNYPFNKATKIQLISFNGYSYAGIDTSLKTLKNMPNLRMPICLVPANEVKILNMQQIDKLSSLFYNYDYIKKPNIFGDIKCYEPRNGILFLDNNDKVFALIEICFDCEKMHLSNPKIKIGSDVSSLKIALIKSFFKNIGIEYGVTKKFKEKFN